MKLGRPGARERALRDALLGAMIPRPAPGLPALADLDLSAFWIRFGETAPLPLRFAIRAASWILGALLPALLGHGLSIQHVPPATRDQLLRRAARWPLASTLLEVVKVVACLAYFDAKQVQTHFRSMPAP